MNPAWTSAPAVGPAWSVSKMKLGEIRKIVAELAQNDTILRPDIREALNALYLYLSGQMAIDGA